MASETTREIIIKARLDSHEIPKDLNNLQKKISKYKGFVSDKLVGSDVKLKSLQNFQKHAKTRYQSNKLSRQIAERQEAIRNSTNKYIGSRIARGPSVMTSKERYANSIANMAYQRKLIQEALDRGHWAPNKEGRGVFNRVASYKKNINPNTNPAKDAYKVFEEAGMTKFSLADALGASAKVKAAKDAIAGLTTKLGPYIAAAKKAWDITKKIGAAFLKVGKGIFKFAAGVVKSKLNISGMIKKLKTFKSAFARVVTYKAIRTFLSIINSGLKTGTNNLYKFSSLLEGKFKTSMDNFATSWLYVQNAVGAFAGTIINVVMPVVTALLDRIAEMANMLAKLSASLLGSGYYQATKQVQKYSDMVSEAAANQNQLMGFDELNVLSSAGADTSSMFGDYSEFTEGLSDIDGVLDKIIDKINTFVASFDIEGLASKLGNKINQIVGYFNKLMDGINFTAIGNKLAAGMNKLVETVKPEELGKALTQKINMVIDLAKGFVEDFKWGEAGTWLAKLVTNWFDSIEWGSLMAAISKGINGVFEFIKSFLQGIDWGEKAEFLANKLNTTIQLIEWDEIGNTINTFIQGLFDALLKFINAVKWDQVGKAVGECIAAIKWKDIFTNALKVVWEAFKAGLTAWASAAANSDTDYINSIYSAANMSTSASKKYSFKDAQVKASGGSVNTGSLFWAGEAGPELVTSVGGRSTVYNEQQLGASIALGNENVVAAINTLIGVVRSKNNNVTISASDIRKAVNSSSMRLGV